MKSAHFDVEPDGFYGAYWKSEQPSDCALVAMLGDDPEDYLAAVGRLKWDEPSGNQRDDHVAGEKGLRPSQLSA